ncbi:MAG TPA: type VI secretion system-associated FHA domain protein TagH [Steroidobacteraceae bacterium]|jgi:type VI secretion system FHA domain protein|nr:type VI secretion system-associated FHA domain protein TagH [Steroidobacteraceae bacterium]
MNLSLEIVSSNGRSLGSARCKVFGPEGGRIGRSADCEWVLANPYISRHHATIRWISGSYYIESTGENGVAIGTPQAMIPKLERRPLKHGDRLFIDEYEVAVGLDSVVGDPAPLSTPGAASGAAAGAFAPADDPFDLGPTRATRALIDPLESAPEELDPLRHIGDGARVSPVVTAPRQEPNWNHTPGVSDHFAAPAVAPAPARSAPPAGVIPDDWDKTTFGRGKSPQSAQPGPPASAASSASVRAPGAAAVSGRAPPSAPAPATQAIPDDWDKTSFSRKQAGAALPVSPAASAAAAADVHGAPPGAPVTARSPARPGSTPAAAVPQRSQPPSSSTPPTAPPRTTRPTAASTVEPGAAAARAVAARPGAAAQRPADSGFDLDALLKSAGVDPASIAPETAGTFGLILRSVVQGVIDVLRARAEIKEQFRLSHTIVKTAENNPLKFAVNAEDALSSLLGKRNPAYLPPVEAFDDAFNDIRFHQLAMLAGMRAGFDHVMSRFDPQQLQESFDKRSKRGGLLSMSGKSRYWEQFAEEFQELAGDREQAFRRLFAEEFAAAYEKQLELLQRSQGKVQR